ncbi:MAG: leucyl aminopeptidase [Burkholderiaceae bacterium]|nr:leucyl aminopeptidase [Burkholderiaceae bacterium]
MDARTLLAAVDDVKGRAADALLVILPARREAMAPGADWAGLLDEALDRADLVLEKGRTLYLHRPAGFAAARLLFVVAGDAAELSPRDMERALNAAAAVLRTLPVKSLLLVWGGAQALDAAAAEAAVRTLRAAQYVYRHTKPSAKPAGTVERLQLACRRADQAAVREGLRRGQALAAGIELARDCANRPGNHLTPTLLAEQARQLAAEQPGLEVEVLDRKAVEKLGMGAFLAVAKGSEEPLQFIVLRYQGAPKKVAPQVLVGKGITFDSGGISLKPAAEMDEMKFDMGGAASVLGVFRAVAQLRPRLNLIGLVPACENLPSGRATKPGDVVTSLSGQTIEVLNTDAEGRLILCDALTYAERFKPAAVIDIATLTGACVIALGHHRSGLFSPDDGLAAGLLAAGEAAADPAWRMPLDDDYDEALKSNFADMANVGPRAGGAITAAMFLKRYAARFRWAHLDIAGTAWKSGAAKGATGRPVALLTHWLLQQAESEGAN